MPSERKQLTKPRKRVTASARARISVKKTRKVVNNGMDGSYLRTDKETVSNADSVTGPSTLTNSNEAILAMLTEIKESNTALARRMDRVEGNSSTPINPRSHTSDQPPVSPQAGSPEIHRSGAGQIRGILASDAARQHHTQHSASNGASTCQPDIQVTQPLQGQAVGGQQSHPQYMGSLPQPHGQPDYSSDRSDAVIPGLQVLRRNPGIAESVNNLLASYVIVLILSCYKVSRSRTQPRDLAGIMPMTQSQQPHTFAGPMRATTRRMEGSGCCMTIYPYPSRLLGN